jgi:hypothetical protein
MNVWRNTQVMEKNWFPNFNSTPANHTNPEGIFKFKEAKTKMEIHKNLLFVRYIL